MAERLLARVASSSSSSSRGRGRATRSAAAAVAVALSCVLADAFQQRHATAQPSQVDVVIVGGGIAGSSLAYHLSKSRPALSVALLEASCCGSQATGLSAGTFWSAGHASSPSSQDSVRFDPICEVNAHSAELYEEVQRRGFSCGLNVCGNLTLASNQRERDLLVQEHARLLGLGYNVLLLCSPEAVCQVEPALRGGNSVAALWTLESGFVEPLLACRSIAEAASSVPLPSTSESVVSGSSKDGSTLLYEDERVTAIIIPSDTIEKDISQSSQSSHKSKSSKGVRSNINHPSWKEEGRRRIEVHTSRGNVFSARHVVIAAGLASPALLRPLGLNMPVFPVQGTMMHLYPPSLPHTATDTNTPPSLPHTATDTNAASRLTESEAAAAAVAGTIKHTIYCTEAELYWQGLYEGKADTAAHALASTLSPVPAYCSHDARGRQVTRHCYGRPVSDTAMNMDGGRGSVLFGGSRIPLLPEGEGSDKGEVYWEVLQGVYKHVLEFYPRMAGLADTQTQSEAAAERVTETGTEMCSSWGAWGGVMPFSQDGRPLVGCLAPLGPQFRGLWVAGGFGPEGIMQAPGATLFLAQQLLDAVREEEGGIRNCDSSIGTSESVIHINGSGGCTAVRDGVMALFDPCRGEGGVSFDSTKQGLQGAKCEIEDLHNIAQ